MSGEIPMTIQGTTTLRNQQRSIPKGVRPQIPLNYLPAMEEVTDCHSISSLAMSDFLDANSENFDVDTSSSKVIFDQDDVATQQKKRRLYRSQYLRCKRLRSKGYSVPIPMKTWMQTSGSGSSSVSSAPLVLTKDDLRRIKNRESAERSRKAINSAIEEAQRHIDIAVKENERLQVERSFLLQNLAIYGAHQSFQVYSPPFNAYPIVPHILESDNLSMAEESMSDLSDSSTFDSLDMNFDFDSTLTDEALELLLNNLF